MSTDHHESSLETFPLAEAFPGTSQRRNALIPCATVVEFVKEPKSTLGSDDDRVTSNRRGTKRPTLVGFKIIKESVDQKLGLGFQSVGGELIFAIISPTSPLANSSIRIGDRLASLDRYQSVSHWSAGQVASYLLSREGLISMVVETKQGDSNTFEACIYKATAEEKLGLSLQNDEGQLRIRSINSGGLLSDMTVLQPGDYVESINSKRAHLMDTTTAYELIKSFVGRVTIRTKKEDRKIISMRDIMLSAQPSPTRRLSDNITITADELDSKEFGGEGGIQDDPSWCFPRPRFISITLNKPTVATRVGVSFANPTGGQLIVSNIGHRSLLCNTPLTAGCVIHSINGIPTARYTSVQATNLVKSLSGTICVRAEDRVGDVSHAIAMVFKPTPCVRLGVAFGAVGSSLSLCNLRSDGLFCNSVLNDGDTVIAINGKSSENIHPKDAVQSTKKNSESATILVRRSPQNAIVLYQGSVVPGKTHHAV